jgi:tRNA (guanine-N7-)-methyltransferase
MGRGLKYGIPGVDWRRDMAAIAAQGWEAVFAPELSPPLHMVVEIGFGRGEFLLDLAEKSPGTAFVGVEVSFKRVLKMARKVARAKLENVRLLEGQAQIAVSELLDDASVQEFWINFSDPWPKKRHARRRLIQPAFVAELAGSLAFGGQLHVSTDDVPYASQIHEALAGEPLLENIHAPRPWLSEVPGRKSTGYELEWRAESRSLHFFDYRRHSA